MINNTPRVRFAPSPTGYLHVGGLRTALYNYLFAKNNNGEFILRIEDTDRNRYVEGAVENLLDTIKWVGLDYDEGPEKEDKYGPYFQSQRLDIYKKHAEELIENGHAYYCFCSPERIKEIREEQQKAKVPQVKYDKHCLHLSKDEIENNLKNGVQHVVRMNVESGEKVVINDIVRGKVEFDRMVIDDQILMKSDGFPTYHLANVVDDHLMKITHVIRGEEWLSSTPKHILLYNFFGWELPEFAHLPLLLNADKSKLSKRQGDVAVEDYKAKGYLKEALLNFVALLGWSTSDNQEYFDMVDLIAKFSLERVHKSGAIFNTEKLNWLNAEHLRKKDRNVLLNMLRDELSQSKYKDLDLNDEYLLLIIEAMRERVSFVKDYIDKCPYFYVRPTEYDESVIKKRWKDDSVDLLRNYIDKITGIENPTKEAYENALKQVAEEAEVGNGRIIHPARIAASGMGIGPGLFDLLHILGKDKVITRINDALKEIPKLVIVRKRINKLRDHIVARKKYLKSNISKEDIIDILDFKKELTGCLNVSWGNTKILLYSAIRIGISSAKYEKIFNQMNSGAKIETINLLFTHNKNKKTDKIIGISTKKLMSYLGITNSKTIMPKQTIWLNIKEISEKSDFTIYIDNDSIK